MPFILPDLAKNPVGYEGEEKGELLTVCNTIHEYFEVGGIITDAVQSELVFDNGQELSQHQVDFHLRKLFPVRKIDDFIFFLAYVQCNIVFLRDVLEHESDDRSNVKHEDVGDCGTNEPPRIFRIILERDVILQMIHHAVPIVCCSNKRQRKDLPVRVLQEGLLSVGFASVHFRSSNT